MTFFPSDLWGWTGDAKCCLYLYFKRSDLSCKMEFIKKAYFVNGYMLFRGIIHIPIQTLRQQMRCLPYKYSVTTLFISPGTEEELVFSAKSSRLLKIPDNYMIPGSVYKKYDTPVYPSKDTLTMTRDYVEDVRRYFHSELCNETLLDLSFTIPSEERVKILSIHQFLATYFESKLVNGNYNGSLNIKQFTDDIKSVYQQAHVIDIFVPPSFVSSAQNMVVSGSHKLKTVLFEWTISVATQAVDAIEKFSQSTHQYVITGAVLFLLFHHYDIVDKASNDELLMIMKLLRLTPTVSESGGQECHGYTTIINSLSGDQIRKDLCASIASLCSHFILQTEGKNMNWLYVLPLYHFIKEISKPFTPIPVGPEIQWSFWKKIIDNKDKFQKHLSEEYPCRFINFWTTFTDQMNLDPVLMKVLLYICPEDQLGDVLSRVPPLLAISFIIFLFSKRKFNKNEEEQLFVNCLKGLEASYSTVQDSEWKMFSDDFWFSSKHLITVATKNLYKGHLSVVKDIFQYCLFIISHLFKRGSSQTLFAEAEELIQACLCHHNVVGGSSIGGDKGTKLPEEIQIWNILYFLPDCHESVTSLWKSLIKRIIEKRSEQVAPDKEKVSLFLRITKLKFANEISQDVMDVFIRMAMDGLSALTGNKDQVALVQSIIFSSNDIANVSKLLSEFIKKRPNTFANGIDELLAWDIWPELIEIARQSSPIFVAMDGESKSIVYTVLTKVAGLRQNIDSGCVTQEDLKKLLKEKENVNRLLKAAGVFLEVERFEIYLDSLNTYMNTVNTVFSSIHDSCIEGYEIMQMDLRRDFHFIEMKEICPGWVEGVRNYFVLSSQLQISSPLSNILWDLADMINTCQIFNKIWGNHIDHLSNKKVSQAQFVEEVWIGTINDCCKLVVTCYDESALADEVDNLFATLEIEEHLKILHNKLKVLCPKIIQLPKVTRFKWIDNVARRLASYRSFKKCEITATYLLKIRECLKWDACFIVLQSITKKKEIVYKLSDVTDFVMETCKLVEMISAKDQQKCLDCLIQCWKIVDWIATDFIGLTDLQRFIDVAYATSADIADDELKIQKLNALRFVGTSVASFVDYIINSKAKQQSDNISSIEQDQSVKLIRMCDGLWNSLEQNSSLPTLLRECTANIQWYKDIKSAHGDVQVNTLEEVKFLLQNGEFIIGKGIPIPCYKMADVLYLYDSTKSKEKYNLEKLQDLESRLVLIAGQSTGNVEVQKFLNVFHTVCIIADTLIKLHELGCIQYIGWQRNFLLNGGNIDLLEEDQKNMSQQLSRWNAAIDVARNNFYVLNSFTMKQLLRLCKDLHPHFIEKTISFSIDEQTCSLLKHLNPCIDTDDIVKTLKETWECIEDDSELSCENLADNEELNQSVSQSPISSSQMSSDEEKSVEFIITKCQSRFTSQQQSMYVELVETNGLDPLWMTTEILTNEQCSMRDITFHVAQSIDAEKKPTEEELLQRIYKTLPDLNLQKISNTASNEPLSKQQSEDNEKQPLNLEMLDFGTKIYISLNRLVKMLTVYNEKVHRNAEIFPRCRNISEIDFNSGFPNLYVAPKAKILETALMFYFKDKEMPLPTQEEILICDEMTTPEEVTLLCRRAIFDPDMKRIFCLVHGEKMSYSTCEASLRELNRLKQGRTGYRLVIICSNEHSTNSHLVTALHSYRRSNPDISDELKSYLRSHFLKPQNVRIGAAPIKDSICKASKVDTEYSYIRIVYSDSPGNGKSLFIQREGEALMQLSGVNEPILSIPIHGPVIGYDVILKKLCRLKSTDPKIIHFDIATSMIEDVDCFLFSVLVLGHLKDYQGNTWRREIVQMYTIEITISEQRRKSATSHLLQLFPNVLCLQSNKCCNNQYQSYDHYVGMDHQKLISNEYQRVYRYLSSQKRHHIAVMDNPRVFVELLQKFVKLRTWSEVDCFVNFLNYQLVAIETSLYMRQGGKEWGQFTTFALKMMIEMSKEFTSTSLMGVLNNVNELKKYEIKQTWNESVHPYILFNQDQTTCTFIGFCIDSIGKHCHAINPRTKAVILHNVMTEELRYLLKLSGVEVSENYYQWSKSKLIEKLARVIGLDYFEDPDPSYVITVDNIMKMLAILMRFRCGIPVVIMGETGCGKTRLLRYLCQLVSQGQMATGDKANVVVLKVHGGTTLNDIENAVEKAELLADETSIIRQAIGQDFLPVFGTVLFFDEANTTDHINLIKEIMCDHKIFGRRIHKDVRTVAACNPYRKHSEEKIRRLESAGLGFSTKVTVTKQRLGSIPLRHLVYRVNELPLRMLSFVFDFGKLEQATENQYIEKIVENKLKVNYKNLYRKFGVAICRVVSWSQNFMKKETDECSFVSLRDIDRAILVFIFFYELLMQKTLAEAMNEKATGEIPLVKCEVSRALLLTMGVCYHSRLESRQEYEKSILLYFKKPLSVFNYSSESVFNNELRCCQEVFLDNMKLGSNIARNIALRENVFMMVVCLSLRIPLFLVGKPGSSKSLAKSIILNSMKGPLSEKTLLRQLKEVQIWSYQCSQLSSSESILKVFNQAATAQKSYDTAKYVAVVVLDEVGLAEDSPNLPLKVLHPLLEDGTEGNNYSVNDVIDRDNRVGFIGISNWALDPAKMNRGIMVIRGIPSQNELEESALQICSEEGIDDSIITSMKRYFKSFATAYQKVLKSQKREFFGLRDFYSLVKMLFWMCKTVQQPPNIVQVKHAIFRNFSGFSKEFGIDVIKIFTDELYACPNPDDKEEARQKCRKVCKEEFKKYNFDNYFNLFYEEFKDKHHQCHLEEYEQLHSSDTFPFDIYQHCQFRHCWSKEDFEDEEINEKYNAEFECYFKKRFEKELWPFIINPDNSASGLVVASLVNKERTMHGESRYLLFLTENYSALQTLQHFLYSPELNESNNSTMKPYILFGSSFPKDRDFTQVYRNINNIKVCMETGRTVVLLNLDHLYESLYDALNQYYIYFGNTRYVDLGLQNHRLKCRIHDNFKLILIAEKEKVYQEFPTALINRLEKHFVVTSTILSSEQSKIKDKLQQWIENFKMEKNGKSFKPADSFIGYQNDTPAAVVFQASRMTKKDESIDWSEEVFNNCKFLLLQIATPDALVRLKRSRNLLEDEYKEIAKVYTEKQQHKSLKDFLTYQISQPAENQICRMQVTTCNDLLSEEEVDEIKTELKLDGNIITCILQEFDTEFEFSRKVREAFQNNTSLLIIQCDSGHLNSDLLACAKYRVDDICHDVYIYETNGCESSVKNFCHVLFTVLIPREHNDSSFVSFLGGDWICAHIDDFSPEYDYCPVTLSISNTPLSLLFYAPDTVVPISPTSSCGSFFNHSRFLYKNIAKALSIWNLDSRFAGRSHAVNNILYRLLMKPVNDDFFTETVKCICQHIETIDNEDWVFEAASESTALLEGGAFVKVLLRSLDRTVNETLAQIVAYADTNYNLELIDPNSCDIPHLRLFWITAYSKLVEFHLGSNSLRHFERRGSDVYDYKCQFPFSWELQQAMESIVNIQGGTGQVNPMGNHLLLKFNILNQIQADHFDDMLRRYVCDLIQLKWSRTFRDDRINNKGLDFIATALLHSIVKEQGALFTVILKCIHQVLDNRKSEITNFKDLIAIFPSILDKLTPDDSMPLDALAAVCALDLINEDHQLLLKSETRSPTSVISKLHRFYQVTNVIETALYSIELDELRDPRLKWQALQVVHLFIEHVVKDHLQYFDRTIQFMNRFRIFIEYPSDFSKQKTVREFELLLSLMNNEFSEAHSQSAGLFSQSCVNFYIAVISNVCMKHGEPDDDLIDKLIDTVFSVAQDNLGSQTRTLTPFIKSSKYDDNVPVIRSYILQLLLHNNFDSTKQHIKKYFEKAESLVSKLTSDDSSVLMSLKLLYCLLHENSLHGSALNAGILLQLLNENKELLPDFQCNVKVSLQSLEAVAIIRFVLMHISQFFALTKEQHDSDSIQTLISSIESLCKNSSINSDNAGPRIFLLKALFRKCGQTGLQKLINKPHLRWIIPKRISGGLSNRLLDFFSIHGKTYYEIRKIVIDLINTKEYRYFNDLQAKINSTPHLLSLPIFMEITMSFSSETAVSREVLTEFLTFVKTQKCFNDYLKDLTISLLDNQFSAKGSVEGMFIQPERSLADKIFTSVVVHIATSAIAMKDSPLLHILFKIITDPKALKKVYLPGMPEDFSHQIRSIFHGQFYVCPEGHPYMITECGAPMEEKECPECKKLGIVTKIGGLRHKLREDNTRRSIPRQTGYILGTPLDVSAATPERSLSPSACTIIKIFIHSLFLWTCCSKSDSVEKVHRIMTYDIEPKDLPRYFWQHLVSNFNSLCEALSIGLDDVAIVIHLIITEILSQKPPSLETGSSFDLLTLESRQYWEREFNHMYIQPVLKDLHVRLEASRELILKDDHSNHPELLDYVYERNIQEPSMIHHLWKYRPEITLEHLLQQLQVREGNKMYPALTFFLQEEVCLRATKFLPAIYQLQHCLHGLHHYRSSHDDILKKTIGEFLNEIVDVNEKQRYRSLIAELQKAWMLVRGKLQTKRQFSKKCIQNDFLEETTLVHLIPRRNSCITGFIEYLIKIHNEFIEICFSLVREMQSTSGRVWKSFRKDKTVKLKDLQKSQLLNYDDKLSAMILSHCHYSLTVGDDQNETPPDYDFASLEKHLLNEFVYGKPLIEYETRFVEFRKEVYTGKKFEKIKEKIKPEVKLLSEAKRELLLKLNRIQQLREALDQILVVMGFLSSGGKENGHTSLKDYATNVLKIEKFNNAIGEGYCLGQIYELWLVISLELSVKTTINGEDPFHVSKCFRKQLSQKDLAHIETNSEHINLEVLLSALNEFIEIHVRNAEENQSRWMIGECMEGYFGELTDKQRKEVKVIGELEMKYLIAVWNKLVKHYRNKP